MLPLLPAYRASNFVATIDTNDGDTQSHDTTIRPRVQRVGWHEMPALGCVGSGRHIFSRNNMVVPDARFISETGDLLQLITLGELILKFSYPDAWK
jgi:hypothetical protein